MTEEIKALFGGAGLCAREYRVVRDFFAGRQCCQLIGFAVFSIMKNFF